jgi:cytoskeletal protein CcmA (bactofilin family)
MLLLGNTGRVEGVVKVGHAVINGTLRGILIVDGAVALHAQARIEGDLYYRSMDMAQGAIVTGKLVHWGEDTPLEQLFALTRQDITEIMNKVELIGKEYGHNILPTENHLSRDSEGPVPS